MVEQIRQVERQSKAVPLRFGPATRRRYSAAKAASAAISATARTTATTAAAGAATTTWDSRYVGIRPTTTPSFTAISRCGLVALPILSLACRSTPWQGSKAPRLANSQVD